MEQIHLTKTQYRSFNKKVVFQIILPIILFTIIALQLVKNISIKTPPNPIISTSYINNEEQRAPPTESDTSIQKCDLYSGDWIPNMDAPYYTNETCWVIQEHQNCMKYGRPDTEFMKWRWKPNDCELPVFDPIKFFEIVRNKSMAFVGDSVARNQMQSLICLLSRVEHPLDVSTSKDDNFKRWYYQSYNFTLVILWSPYLVKTIENDPNGRTGKTFWGLHLDEADDVWKDEIDKYDYVIVSAGQWFFRPLIYYEKGQFMGCRYCEIDNLTEYSLSFGFRNAFRTAFKAILERESFKGKVYMRTFVPGHFEGGEWDHGGDCLRKRPYKSNEVKLEGETLELYTAQMEEFREGQRLAQQRGLSLQLLDMTQIMLLRPDGHPSTYGRPANLTWPSDCVHWCLPGPIDSWSDFLLKMLD
ncbi:protein trichome birefringence-like 19 [Chenopodium quinoa]|uniref:Trichome birefringence-like N-terminal domain-containing protein n=1 Tax=Chenopodium quinoa TaxID=63459 RepID=A0A803LAQ7_CHEQI|nr:protein trichome birefringence-like 19 [Chenopodium quinoa]